MGFFFLVFFKNDYMQFQCIAVLELQYPLHLRHICPRRNRRLDFSKLLNLSEMSEKKAHNEASCVELQTGFVMQYLQLLYRNIHRYSKLF
jgi:hypothetical protein